VRRLLAAAALLALLSGCASPADDHAGDAAANVPAAEAGIERGQLTAAADGRDHEVAVKAGGHSRLAVTLVLKSNLPENEVRLNVTGPSTAGQQVETAPFLYVYPGANPTLSFAEPAAGSWTAHVRLTSGSTADYEVHWCADDETAPGPQDNLACHRSYG
jgi:hypothetical protein